MKRTMLFITACILFASGCAPNSPAELTDADKKAIGQFMDELARSLSPEDNEAWANTFTEDAVLMFPDTPTKRGRQVLKAWGEDSGETGSPVALSVSYSDIEIHGSGDVAWLTANSTAELEGLDEPSIGRQLMVLERQPDGTWLQAAASLSFTPATSGN